HAKTLELPFRQRKHAFLRHGVMSSESSERLFPCITVLADCDLPFLHRFKQRTLCLLRRAVDFICKDDVGEDGPLLRAELAAFAVEDLCSENVGRKHIWRELDALELRINRTGDCGNEQCLCKARHA